MDVPASEKEQGHDERIGAHLLDRCGNDFMTCRDDQLTDPVDRFRRQQAHVVSDSPPLKFGFCVPQTDAHGGSQLDVVFTQIVQLIVRQVAPQSNARKYQQVPVIHTFASTVRAGIAVHILTDQIKHFLLSVSESEYTCCRARSTGMMLSRQSRFSST